LSALSIIARLAKPVKAISGVAAGRGLTYPDKSALAMTKSEAFNEIGVTTKNWYSWMS